MRKLVHIEKVKSLKPIDGADFIELAQILDWQLIVKKGEFKVGDLAVYHEIDSLCPEKECYEFLRQKKFKIKTMKMKGELSQGLALPLSILPPGHYKEGQDVTDILGVLHCDSESRENMLSRKAPRSKFMKFMFKFSWFRKLNNYFTFKDKSGWPEFVQHTDEENIQAIFSKVKRDFGDQTFYVTEKVDYQSATYFTRNVKKFIFGIPVTKKIFGVLSRSLYKKTDDGSLWWKNAKKFNIEQILRSYDEELTIQGESGDTNVQGNKYQLKESSFWVFNIINNRTGYHYSIDEMEDFCNKHDLKMAPVLDKNFKLPETVGELIEYSRGKSVINHKTDREGVVIRLIKDGKKLVSFKVKNPDFLIKNKE
jgi:hypothetical protein